MSLHPTIKYLEQCYVAPLKRSETSLQSSISPENDEFGYYIGGAYCPSVGRLLAKFSYENTSPPPSDDDHHQQVVVISPGLV